MRWQLAHTRARSESFVLSPGFISETGTAWAAGGQGQPTALFAMPETGIFGFQCETVLSMSWRIRSFALSPAELFQRVAIVPDLGHVPDLVTVEIHHIGVVGGNGFYSRRSVSCVYRVCTVGNCTRGYVSVFVIDSERLQLVMAIRNREE